MDLTYKEPQVINFDSARPAESWFFYWKTSVSLWKEHIEKIPSKLVLVPIYWGFHTEDLDFYDFANKKPETNLKKILNIATSLGKEVLFLLPITPVPFLPHGGVPNVLAKNLSLDEQGVIFCTSDFDNKIHKLVSFFDQKVVSSYSNFVSQINKYFVEEGLNVGIAGLNCGYLHENKFTSYIKDYSTTFHQNFTKYSRTNFDSSKDKKLQKYDFLNSLEELYKTIAEDALGGSWEGILNFAFLGGAPQDFLKKSDSSYFNSLQLIRELEEIKSLNVFPSESLIPAKFKLGAISKFLHDTTQKCEIFQSLASLDTYEDSNQFEELTYFNIVYKKEREFNFNSNLIKFLKANFKSSVKYFDYNYISSNFEPREDNIYFFRGEDIISESEFRNVIKIFMMGGKVVLDKANMSAKHEKRLELFFIENALKIEKINLKSSITFTQLGEGQLIVLSSGNLKVFKDSEQIGFWESLIKTFNLRFIDFAADNEVLIRLRKRSPLLNELSYQQVQRLSLYNPGSDTKKIQIPGKKNFAFLKVIDELNSKASTNQAAVQVELKPGGTISLDYGYYE